MPKTENQSIIHEFTIDPQIDPKNPGILGGDCMVNDNLDSDIDFEDPNISKMYGNATKVTGHQSLFFCVQGQVNMTCNSVPCVLRAGDVTYAQSGHIGCVTKFSPNARFFLVAVTDDFYMPPLSAAEMAAFRSELSIHPVATLNKQQ